MGESNWGNTYYSEEGFRKRINTGVLSIGLNDAACIRVYAGYPNAGAGCSYTSYTSVVLSSATGIKVTNNLIKSQGSITRGHRIICIRKPNKFTSVIIY